MRRSSTPAGVMKEAWAAAAVASTVPRWTAVAEKRPPRPPGGDGAARPSRGHPTHKGKGQRSFFVGKDNVLSEGQGAGSIRFLCQNPLRNERLHVLVHGDFADAQDVRQLLHGR